MSFKARLWVMSFLLPLVFAGCNDGVETSDSNGPLKSVTYFNRHEVKTNTVVYHRNGKIKEEISFNDDGTVSDHITYRYDDRFQLLERFDSAAYDRYVYTYDEQGRQRTETNTDHSGTYVTTSYYLDDGNLRIDSTTRHGWVTVSALNNEGQTTAWWKIDAEGDTASHSVTLYNEDGLEADYVGYDEGRFTVHRKYIYDENDNVLSEVFLLEDGSVERKYTNTYDEQGRLIQIERLDSQGNPDFLLKYKYEGNERFCRTTIPGTETSFTKEAYTYYPAGEGD